MSSRSIVDRVLLFAAAVCAAGLLWQLAVLVTSKDHAASLHKLDSVSPAAAQTSSDPLAAPPASTVRVVYADGISAKAVGKAMDTADGTPADVGINPPLTPVLSTTPGSPPSAASTPKALGQALSPQPALAMGTSSPVIPVSAPVASTDDAADPAHAQMADLAPGAPSASSPPTPSAAEADIRRTPSGMVDINRASVEDLNHLQGAGRIGEAIARHRPYRSIEDLLKKRVVRRNVYEQIKGQLAAE